MFSPQSVIIKNIFLLQLAKRMNRILLLLTFILMVNFGQAQIVVQLTIDSGMATTDCTDIIGAPDPLFSVAVEGGAYTWYPEISNCYTALPHTSFMENYACQALVPVMIEVCLKVIENDPLIGPPLDCSIVESCPEILCQDFIVPPFGNTASYNLTINEVGSSSGEVNFTIETTGFAFPDNDLICNAVDFGTVAFGDTLGDNTQGSFSNLCATNIGDIDPLNLGAYFSNEHGVWFQFTTSANPGGLIVVQALSDPNNVGAPVDMQMAIFTSDNDACDGNLTLLGSFNQINDQFDHEIRFPCPAPNTTYFVLIDGSENLPDAQGVFGLHVWDVGVQEGGDLRCDFLDLGVVPENGSVSTPEPLANFCATDVQDPFLPTFVSQHSVWLSFVAPESGHVIIEGISDTEKAPIGIQLALYRSFNNTCSGFFSYVTSQFTPADLDEVMEATCLFPGRRYFILVDGSGSAPRGVFGLTVTDAGDITPVENQTITLCFGETLSVGPIIHSATGIYSDTLQIFQGCDSIVNTDLTILDELVVSINQTQPAIGIDGMDGVAEVTAVGGTGVYSYEWCTGETTGTATTLVAGQMCCVTVTDSNDCMEEICFEVAFTIAIIPTFEDDSLNCFGDDNGAVNVVIINGVPPYNYNWSSQTGTSNGNGMVNVEGGSFTMDNLVAGAYDVSINDAFLDTSFVVNVFEPAELTIQLVESTNASCFEFCDGNIMTLVEGGTLPYTYNWSGGQPNDEANIDLCAGDYNLEIVDNNACSINLLTSITQPAAFIATANVFQEVACFEGDDGVAFVTNNGNAVGWEWDNGGDSEIVDGLSAGIYQITVTNGDGCLATTSVEMPQPSEPLIVAIQELQPISCFGDSDGQLGTNVTGPFVSLTYVWSNEDNTENASGLMIGDYEVSVFNEKGCEATANYTLTQPTEIIAETFATDINCLDGPKAGVITIENVNGGTPNYTYGLESGSLGQSPLVEGLEAGTYDVVVRDAAGCELIIVTSILPPPEVTITLNSTHTIGLGETVHLNAMSNSINVLYTWSHTDTLSTASAIVQPMETTLYQISIIDTLTFCTAARTISIFVDQRPRVYAPNIFSPNGDGNNDKFFISGGSDVINIASLRIFARGGQLVYEDVNLAPNEESRGWDGKLNREPMNPDVFVFVAEVNFFDGRTEIIKGDLLLIR